LTSDPGPPDHGLPWRGGLESMISLIGRRAAEQNGPW
jgi:hypothetical protein